MKNSKKSILFRVIKEVFTAYPVLFPLVLVGIVFTAGVSSIPSLFIQKIVSLLEARDPSVSWSVFSKERGLLCYAITAPSILVNWSRYTFFDINSCI